VSTLNRSDFQSMYEGQPPWEIGKPQNPFIEKADQITGTVLDAGCGTGETALFLAACGCKVTGIDFLEGPINIATQKALERKSTAVFLVQDALSMTDWRERFDNVVDSGLFHVFSDADRVRYAQSLHQVLKPGGRLFLMCFSDEEPGTNGPRRVSKKELNAVFARGWAIESIEPVRVEVRSEFKGLSEGGPKAWFAVVRRGA
jgi:cyclopropane fatty-acyl-phospholipid synthase-like methyltransferase